MQVRKQRFIARSATSTLLAAITACGLGMPVAAQQFPAKSIRIVVGYTAGGTADLVSRLVARSMSEKVGQQVYVDNRPSAGGLLANELVANAAPDGYTLLLANSSFAYLPSMYTKLIFDTRKDFVPVALVATTQNLLVVHPAVPARNVHELVALAKRKRGALNYASAGTGSSNHLTVEMFDLMANIKTTHVPYKGTGPALVDLMGGQIDFVINDLSSLITYINTGKLKAIAVASSKRNAGVNVPTIAETVPGYEAEAWYGLLAPAKTPPAIVSKLYDGVIKALRTTDLRERLKATALDTVGDTPQEFLSYMQRDIAKWTKVVKAAGVKLD